MEIEQLEIRDFLKNTSPMQQLSAVDLDRVSSALQIAYQRLDDTILEIGQSNDELFLLRSGAVEVRDENGVLRSRLDVGSWFGYTAIMGDSNISCDVRAIEDSLLYVIPGDTFRTILSNYHNVAQYFSQHKPERLRHAVQGYRDGSHEQQSSQVQEQLISSKVGEVTHRPAILIAPDLPIVDAAKTMAAKGRTSLLVAKNEALLGIVTEREFCKRVVAAGLDASRPISEIMTPEPIMVDADTPVSEALLTMARHNVHHLPFVMDEGGYSVVTGSNLIQFQSHNPLFMVNDIGRANRVEHLGRISKKLPDLLVDLVRSSLTAYDVGHLISSIGEAITQRLLVLAEDKFGPPPVAYAWVAAGSLARDEQTAHSDQDNAIILSDDFQDELHDDYFKSLAAFVSDGLDACGYVYCPGDVMATNPKWRVTQSAWRALFHNWIMEPEKKSLMYASIFFDLRCLHGDDNLLSTLLKEVYEQTQGNQRFLSNLAANALQFRPPIGLFRQFVLESGGAEEKALNLKKRGVVPVTDLARVYVLSAGLSELHTEDRLKAAAEAKELSQSGMADLVDAYEFIASVRLQHQCLQIERGEQADNFVSPDLLSSFERRHLKDAFDVVSTLQSALKQRYL